MPLARRRMRRAGVVGPAPVARTAATVATVAVVAHGVNRRRTDGRPARRPQGPPRLTVHGNQYQLSEPMLTAPKKPVDPATAGTTQPANPGDEID